MTNPIPAPAPLNLDDHRRAITHALGYGVRVGWAAVQGGPPADLGGPMPGDGEPVAVTFTRGAQTIVCNYRIMNGFYRFVGARCGDGRVLRTWARVAHTLLTRR